MFASPYVAGLIATTLLNLSDVTDVVADRIYRRFVPQVNGGYVTPFVVFRMVEEAIDDAPIGAPVATQALRFEVAVYDEGQRVFDALPVAEAFDAALQDTNYTVPGKGWHITCRRISEIPDLDLDYGLPFVRVGGIYAFDVG